MHKKYTKRIIYIKKISFKLIKLTKILNNSFLSSLSEDIKNNSLKKKGLKIAYKYEYTLRSRNDYPFIKSNRRALQEFFLYQLFY